MTSSEDIADTAFLTASARAAESERADALFRDPLAATLLPERQPETEELALGSGMRNWSIAIRTVVIDELITEAIAAGVEVVVNLGAGLDTRPYRMDLPASLRWYEVDQANIIAHKKKRLEGESPCCNLERIAADLTNLPVRRDLLAAIGSRAEGPILVITEGVLPYWPNDVVGDFAEDLRGMAAVKGWITDHIPTHVIAARRRMGVDSEKTPLLFDPPDWRGFFADHGWRPAIIRNLFDAGLRLGRPMPLPADAPIMSGNEEVRSRMFPGYAMLERIE